MNPRLRSNIFIYSSIAAAGLLGVLLLLRDGGPSSSEQISKVSPSTEKEGEKTPVDVIPLPPSVQPEPEEEIGPEGLVSKDPAQILQRIAAAFQKGDLSAAEKMIGQTALSPGLRQELEQLSQSGKLKPRAEQPIQEIGELELDKRSRWAIWLDGAPAGQERIFFELQKNDAGKWSIASLTLPRGDGLAANEPAFQDSLGIADTFLQAVLRQDFVQAKKYTASHKISDATIAGLCILFEEGAYHLRPEHPLRVLLQRDDTTGYLANVLTSDGQSAAEFSLVLSKAPAEAPAAWLLTELDLDKLLADYAQRVAGGDVYFTPLVKNPKGGDTLVLYFDFNEGQLSARCIRQLEIVASILRTDVGKKLNLSGHTDAIGSAEYNQGLSSKRAEAVKAFLVQRGVAASQIITEAEGSRQPRRPNFTESGADNPDGRRANRRTEIYLDF